MVGGGCGWQATYIRWLALARAKREDGTLSKVKRACCIASEVPRRGHTWAYVGANHEEMLVIGSWLPDAIATYNVHSVLRTPYVRPLPAPPLNSPQLQHLDLRLCCLSPRRRKLWSHRCRAEISHLHTHTRTHARTRTHTIRTTMNKALLPTYICSSTEYRILLCALKGFM